MLSRLSVSNYRSLDADVQVDLGRLTFLVGRNGSGKSNLLDVVAFVRDAISLGLPAAITKRNGVGAIRRYSAGRPRNVEIRLDLLLDGTAAHYAFGITGDSQAEYRVSHEEASVTLSASVLRFERDRTTFRGPVGLQPRVDDLGLVLPLLGGSEEFGPLVEHLARMSVYSIFPDKLSVPQRFDSARPMLDHGDNWVSVLKELIAQDGPKGELLAGLHKLTGDIEDVRVTSAASHLIAEFEQRTEQGKTSWFDASQHSDGTLRVAGLLTALLQTPPLSVIGVEEPELTVHPGALPLIYDFLAQASTVSQILVTTHSPVLLDVVNLDQSTILGVDRSGGKTRVQTVDQATLASVREGLLQLGDLLLSGDLQHSLFEDAEEA